MRFIRHFIIIFIPFIMLSACAEGLHSAKAKEHHVGVISPSQLLTSYQPFQQEYKRYAVADNQALSLHHSEDIEIDVYFGTWCHDSQREVPRLIKILENYDAISVNLIALNYEKDEPTGRAKQAGVQFTPTIIVKRQGKEIGRIVERPVIDLVTDINELIYQ